VAAAVIAVLLVGSSLLAHALLIAVLGRALFAHLAEVHVALRFTCHPLRTFQSPAILERFLLAQSVTTVLVGELNTATVGWARVNGAATAHICILVGLDHHVARRQLPLEVSLRRQHMLCLTRVDALNLDLIAIADEVARLAGD